jgi:hypothetical protein
MFRPLFGTVVILFLFAGCGTYQLGAENFKKIIGTWEDSTDGDRTYEFREDGGYKTTSKFLGVVVEGKFRIRGNEATISFKIKRRP